jgi:peptidoglycan/xylan/chitin deacetylase (PgdA/CDA1 family)
VRRPRYRSRSGRGRRRAGSPSELGYGITRAGSRPRWGRRLAAITAALVLVAALSVASLSSSPGQPRRLTHDPTPIAPGPLGRPVASSGVRAPRSPSLTQFQRRELHAIDATLRYTPVITEGSRRRREIALTFDDGPSQYTEAILRILERRHVPATFFIVGQQLNRFATGLRDESWQRMGLGDHTETHPWLARLDPRRQNAEIADAALRISRDGGTFPRLFRPPYGAFTAVTVKLLHRLHMLLVLWSIDPQDWRRPGVGPIVSAVLSGAHPGAIVLMHDGGGYRDQTVKALPSIIDGLRRRHFELVTVPRLILDDPPPRHQRLPRFAGA